MPTRTCVGCQKTDEQAKLLRWVAEASGRIKIDEDRAQSGRGAYVHRSRKCVEAAVRGGFSRSFRRRTQPLDAERLWQLVEDKGLRA
jgi:hypothetical protein